MKKILVIASVALFTACTSKNSGGNESSTSGTGTSTQMKDITSPYPINYSSKFAIDDPKYAEALLNLWKEWDNGDLSKSKDKFADTIEMHFSDGTTMKASRDSVIAMGQKMRTSLGTVVSSVDAIMALKSTDRNEHWAAIWGMEKDTDAKGKSDSSYMQEIWRFDSTGKANLMYQYRQAGAPPKMMKK
ncbi:MAG TPA: hypothetical protein VHD35_17795 [Chitinophagaceae bacterium]|nr:hypothetical protein [Chitinophagaceae bacterium]